MRRALPFVLLVSVLVPLPGPATAAGFLVGAAVRDITPSQEMIDTGRFYLGGYGIASGRVGLGPASAEAIRGRKATGVMADPLGGAFVRAVAVSDGHTRVVFADLDNQGMFAGYKVNPETGATRPGIDDIREQVYRDTGLPPSNVVISSDHSHAGQDLTGVWGLVPDEYFAFVFTRAVEAIEGAIFSLRPAEIREGAVLTPGPCEEGRILNNQFGCDEPPEDKVDNELRVLQATDARGAPIVTLVNFAAHATVMGSGNRLVSADWPGVVARYVEQRYGGIGATIVADVGRSQPARSDCTADEAASGAFDVDPAAPGESCKLSKYSRGVMSYVDRALADAQPIASSGVQAETYFIHDPANSAALFALNYGGDPVGAPIARANTAPYLAGTVIGTWVSVFRIGDVLVTTAPGEAYPNIREQTMQQVDGPRRFWTFGLANDQLGYLVAPTPEGYPVTIQHGVQGNDNYFFNVSHTIGDHVMCKHVQGAGAIGFTIHDAAAKCAPFFNEPSTAGPGGTRPAL
jgi:hypothetical protein